MFCAITLPLTVGCEQLFGPSNFDDCILINMRGVTSDNAAVQIRRACRAKFPEKAEQKSNSRDLNPWEVAAITGRASLAYGTRYTGNLYNGNKDVTVTQVQIGLTTTEGGKETNRLYTLDLTLPPQVAKDFGVDIVIGDKGSEYSWTIAAARGF